MSLPPTFRRWYLSERPKLPFNPHQCLKLETLPLMLPSSPDECLIRVDYVATVPGQRVWMSEKPSYTPPIEIGETMRAPGVGEVVVAGGGFSVGDKVFGLLGWAEYQIRDMKKNPVFKAQYIGGAIGYIDYMHALSANGLTACVGLLESGKLKEGETLLVSGAAGGIGSLVCQIGKIKGCKVIAIAGSDEKCAFLKDDLGVDVAINYKSPEFVKVFEEALAPGIDVFFDSIGGPTLDLALLHLNQYARVVCNGSLIEYNDEKEVPLYNTMQIIRQRSSMIGFIILDHFDKLPKYIPQMVQWITEGKLKTKRIHLVHGDGAFEKLPDSIPELFEGKNIGQYVTKLSNIELI